MAAQNIFLNSFKCVCSSSMSSGSRRVPKSFRSRTDLCPIGDFCAHSLAQSFDTSVPRLCNLREFSDEVKLEDYGLVVVEGTGKQRMLFQLLFANVESMAQVKSFEILSGRLAMIAFAFALGLESATGSSFFHGIDLDLLEKVFFACLVAVGGAAGLAFAWKAQKHAADILTSECKYLLDSAIDKVIDGLFYEEPAIVDSNV